jgi:hypothetical protein
MSTISVRSAAPLQGVGMQERWIVLATLLIVALVTRFSYFGNPEYHVDEEFYFLVAQRMWQGDLPFVDIWDRKPIGLFLIYGALWPLRHGDMLAVQIAGLGFSVATGYVLWQIARRQLPALLASLPGTLYLLWMPVFGGANGQSPVFYNLFMALAARLLLEMGDHEAASTAFRRKGLLAMLLVGLAIQVKYVAVVEGAFFGLYLVGLALARGMPVARVVRLGAAGALCVFGPTIAALGVYAALGHADAFVFANFQSIFLRARLAEPYLQKLTTYIVLMGLPLFVVSLGAVLKVASGLGSAGRMAGRDRLFLIGWSLAAFGGFISVGNFYDHYALPLLPPLLALCACLFEAAIPTFILVLLLGAWPVHWAPRTSMQIMKDSRETVFGLAEAMRPYLPHGGLFIYDGPSFLYVAADAKPLTRFAYPDHLSNLVEQTALGIDTGKEMARILAARPAVIVTSDRGIIPRWNMATRPQLLAALTRDYREIARGKEGRGYRSYIVNVRRDLLADQAD